MCCSACRTNHAMTLPCDNHDDALAEIGCVGTTTIWQHVFFVGCATHGICATRVWVQTTVSCTRILLLTVIVGGGYTVASPSDLPTNPKSLSILNHLDRTHHIKWLTSWLTSC